MPSKYVKFGNSGHFMPLLEIKYQLFCLETVRVTMLTNKYQALFSTKDHCVQNSEGSVN